MTQVSLAVPALILSAARILIDGGQPRSVDYGDIYCSRDGQRETHRVFIAPLEFEAMCECADASGLSVGELGFGAGMNFLSLCEVFLQRAPANARLDYIAFEKHPLTRTDLVRILAHRTFASELREALVASWPARLEGWHCRYFAAGRIRLVLHQGEALEGLLDFTGRCHAWLLDGFDPRCNPEMWSQQLFETLNRRSQPGARLATYTAQGEVRRRLESVGFSMQRVDQRPHKRHSLVGRLGGEKPSTRAPASQVAVVGAGFAGTFSAHLLSLRGADVHLFDQPFSAHRSGPMPVAIAHARLGRPDNPLMRLRALASGYSNDWYRRLDARRGVLEAPVNPRDVRRIERQASLWGAADDCVQLLAPDQAQELIKATGIGTSLWHTQCHVLGADRLHRLLRHAGITRHAAGPGAEILSCVSSGRGWTLYTRRGTSHTFGQVVICAGAGSLGLLPNLGASTLGGQMDLVRMSTALSGTLVGALIGEGFAAPLDDGRLAVGATYESSPLSEEEASGENLARAKAWLRALGVAFAPTHQGCWRGLRVYHGDRLPLVGEVAPGLYINTAHGSAGSILAPLCAELLTNQMCGGALAVSQTLAAEIRPNR